MQSYIVGEAKSFLNVSPAGLYPNVADLHRGKTRQSAPDVAARRLGQDEAYLTVRDILSEASTVSDGVLWRERSDFVRFGSATLGFTLIDVI